MSKDTTSFSTSSSHVHMLDQRTIGRLALTRLGLLDQKNMYNNHQPLETNLSKKLTTTIYTSLNTPSHKRIILNGILILIVIHLALLVVRDHNNKGSCRWLCGWRRWRVRRRCWWCRRLRWLGWWYWRIRWLRGWLVTWRNPTSCLGLNHKRQTRSENSHGRAATQQHRIPELGS